MVFILLLQQLASKLLPSIALSSDWTVLCLAGAGALSLDSNILIAKYFLVNINRETVIISNTLTATFLQQSITVPCLQNTWSEDAEFLQGITDL